MRRTVDFDRAKGKSKQLDKILLKDKGFDWGNVSESNGANNMLPKLEFEKGDRDMTRFQKMFVAIVIVTFLCPIKFHMDWYTNWRSENNTWKGAVHFVLETGGLFFYALTLGFATLSEIKDNPKIRIKPRIFWLKVACWLPLIIFVFEYMLVRYRIVPPDEFYIWIQVSAAILAASVAIMAKSLIYFGKPTT